MTGTTITITLDTPLAEIGRYYGETGDLERDIHDNLDAIDETLISTRVAGDDWHTYEAGGTVRDLRDELYWRAIERCDDLAAVERLLNVDYRAMLLWLREQEFGWDRIPTFGPRTDEIEHAIEGCDPSDIVISWDTERYLFTGLDAGIEYTGTRDLEAE